MYFPLRICKRGKATWFGVESTPVVHHLELKLYANEWVKKGKITNGYDSVHVATVICRAGAGASTAAMSGRSWSTYLACLVDFFGRRGCVVHRRGVGGLGISPIFSDGLL